MHRSTLSFICSNFLFFSSLLKNQLPIQAFELHSLHRHTQKRGLLHRNTNTFPLPTSPIPIFTNLRASSSPSIISCSEECIQQKQQLFNLLQSAPSNVPTPPTLTNDILEVIRGLEQQKSFSSMAQTEQTSDGGKNEIFLKALSGNWELLWTTQDKSSRESNQIFSWINPLENQAYSNNPTSPKLKNKPASTEVEGRLNPILPRNIQDRLENWGILTPTTVILEEDTLEAENTPSSSSSSTAPLVKSSQSVDLKKQRVRNVVSFQLQLPKIFQNSSESPSSSKLRGSLTVDIAFQPSPVNPMQIDVKFQACRVRIIPKQSAKALDINFPLGFIGPTGWLSTTYMDEDIRITRGHKGSVFILSRSSSFDSSL